MRLTQPRSCPPANTIAANSWQWADAVHPRCLRGAKGAHNRGVAKARCAVLVELTLLVTATCTNGDSTRTAATPTTIVVTTPTTSTTAMTTEAPTSEMSMASTSITADATSAVLAAAVLYRATDGNSWDDPNRFNTFYVVERLGHADADGFITGLDTGRLLTDAERTAIEEALAPDTVYWVPSRESVIGDQPPMTIPETHAIITVAEPVLNGSRAEVATELWCGFDCGVGSTSVLEQSSTGDWTVTEQIGGYVA